MRVSSDDSSCKISNEPSTKRNKTDDHKGSDDLLVTECIGKYAN